MCKEQVDADLKSFVRDGCRAELLRKNDWIAFIESDNGFSRRWAKFIIEYNEFVKFIRPEDAKTREELLHSVRSSASSFKRCGYRPKWLKEFEE